MSLYIKLIDNHLGQVVRPMTMPHNIKWPKIHDLSNNTWDEYHNFENEYYYFRRRYSSDSELRYEIYHPRYPKQEFSVSRSGTAEFSARSGHFNNLTYQGNRTEIRLNPHHLIHFKGRDRFIFGANLAWLDNRYGHDFNRNLSNDSLNNLDEYFSGMETIFKCHIVRIWLFEKCEGLIFNSGRVEMDERLRNSVRTIQNKAQEHGLFIYWCLLSSPPESQEFNKDIEIIRSAENPQTSPFLNQALRTFIEIVSEYSNVFAIDVMNEPEKYVARGRLSWENVRKYIKECRDAIKNYSENSLLVSCGSTGGGWTNVSLENAMVNYKGLGLDFYDFHWYNDDGILPMSFDQLCKKINLDKPCIIGEFGQSKNSSWDDDLQKQVVRNFIEQSWNLGYGGCLVWHFNFKNFRNYYLQRHITERDMLKKVRNSLIYNNGSPRPVREPMRNFDTNFAQYTAI